MIYSIGAERVRLCTQLTGFLPLFQERNDELALGLVAAAPSLQAGGTDTKNWVLCALWAGGTKEVTSWQILGTIQIKS